MSVGKPVCYYHETKFQSKVRKNAHILYLFFYVRIPNFYGLGKV
jgi:hypothetical protein